MEKVALLIKKMNIITTLRIFKKYSAKNLTKIKTIKKTMLRKPKPINS